jgi:hypothetical protein
VAGDEHPLLRVSGHAGKCGDNEREKDCGLGHGWTPWKARMRFRHEITNMTLNRLPLELTGLGARYLHRLREVISHGAGSGRISLA